MTRKPPLGDWNSVSDAVSSDEPIAGPPTPDVATLLMIDAAFLPASESRPSLMFSYVALGSSTILPPPPATSALIHTA